MPADENRASAKSVGTTGAGSIEIGGNDGPADNSAALMPVAGVAASADGLKASRALISHLRKDTGTAFVLIQHLDPRHPSIPPELLAKDSPLNVREIVDRSVLGPDVIYSCWRTTRPLP